MKKNLLFITSANLTTNPRIYKELALANACGYGVTFVGFILLDWADKQDRNIKTRFPSVQFIYYDATRKNFFRWVYVSLLQRFCKLIWPLNKRSLKLAAFAHSKRTIQLTGLHKLLKANHFDAIIAHTLPALYVAYRLSKKLSCTFAFDIEDYHPGERIVSDIHNEQERRRLLLSKILPEAVYVTSAAPLISEHTAKLVPGIKINTILNYFPKDEFVEPTNNSTDKKLSLVWFSQNIDQGRGLELILSIWNQLNPYFDLTLIGKINPSFYEKWITGVPGIIIKAPLPQSELHRSLSDYDIGLAIDVETADYNRNLAITNKILAYFQAGLYVLATDTLAQVNFIKEKPYCGVVLPQSAASFQTCLLEIYANRKNIRIMNKFRFTESRENNWEQESQHLMNVWNDQLVMNKTS